MIFFYKNNKDSSKIDKYLSFLTSQMLKSKSMCKYSQLFVALMIQF